MTKEIQRLSSPLPSSHRLISLPGNFWAPWSRGGRRWEHRGSVHILGTISEDKVYVCVCGGGGGAHVYVNVCASCVCGCVHVHAHVCIFRFHQGHPRIESETRQLRVERAPGPQRPLQDPTTPAPSRWHCHLLFSPCPLSAP